MEFVLHFKNKSLKTPFCHVRLPGCHWQRPRLEREAVPSPLSKGIYLLGGLQKPELPFNEKRHTRYVQSSESYMLKLRRKNTALVRKNLYEPNIQTLNYDDLYAFC